MNTDEIIRMAQECQLIGMRPHSYGIYEQSLVHFAALVAAAEREACAKMCEELECDALYDRKEIHPIDCAIAIRSRGNDV